MQRSLWIIVSVLFMALGAPTAHAGTEYAYTGNPYTNCYGSYALSATMCQGLFAPSITLDVTSGTPLDSLINSNITANIYAFSFTDGSALDINQGDTSALSVIISTDYTGDITAWTIDGGCFDLALNQCMYSTSNDLDESVLGRPISGVAINFDDSGEWTKKAVSTPEPSNCLLLGVALVGLLGARRKLLHV
jgi:hypothetical protein